MAAEEKPEEKDKKAEAPAGAEEKAPDAGSDAKPADDAAGEKSGSDDAAGGKDKAEGDDAPAKKPNGLKQTLKRFWLYLVIVLLIATIGAVFAVVSSLQKKKTPPPPSVQSQTLTQDQLKQQAAKAGLPTSGQTLTIQGDAILDGQDLVKGNLYVAGGIEAGGTLSIPNLTISNNGLLGNAQISKLQVAKTAAFSGVATMQGGLDLNGPTSISNVTVGTLTATKLILTGNGVITVPNHLAFTGAFPHRTISFGVLGNGGEASVNGSDTSGTVSLNTGSGPRAGCFITVIFLIPFAGTPNILLGPIGLGAAGSQSGDGLHAYAQLITDDTGNTSAFKICTPNTPLANQAFAFSYLVNGSPH